MTEARWYEHRYPMLGSLFSIPLYLLGFLAKDHFWWVSRFNSILFLLSLIWFYRLVAPLVESKDIARRYILLLMGAGMFSKHITDFYAEIFTATTIALAFLSLAHGKLKKGFLLSALGVTNTPSLIIGVSLAYCRKAIQHKLARFLLPIGLAATGVFLENFLRRGNPLNFGYWEEAPTSAIIVLPSKKYAGFEYPFFIGIMSVLFSFGKGILWFIPGIIYLPKMWKSCSGKLQELFADWSMVGVGMLLLYSNFLWQGGWYWGPRFFLFFCFPALLAVALMIEKKDLKLPQNLLRFVVVTLSVWVSANGVTFGQDNMEMCKSPLEPLCWYSVEMSALWRPFFVEEFRLKGRQIAFLVWHFLVWLNFATLIFPTLRNQIREIVFNYIAKACVWKEWKI